MEKLYEKYFRRNYLHEISNTSSFGKKMFSVVAHLALPVGLPVLSYKLLRGSFSQCYRKCFGDNILYTSTICQKQCKYDLAVKTLNELKKSISQCKTDMKCKEKYNKKIMSQQEKIKKMQSDLQVDISNERQKRLQQGRK